MNYPSPACMSYSLFAPCFSPNLSSGHPLPDLITIPDTTNKKIARRRWSSGDALTWPEHAEKVKAAFVHVYVGYKTYAFGMGELKSVSNGGVNK